MVYLLNDLTHINQVTSTLVALSSQLSLPRNRRQFSLQILYEFK